MCVLRCGEALKEGLQTGEYKSLVVDREYLDSKGKKTGVIKASISYHKDDHIAANKLADVITNRAIEYKGSPEQ